MITIKQLLESVDLSFEPRWVTKNENGEICIWNSMKPEFEDGCWLGSMHIYCAKFKLAEFEGKCSRDCIYEVPRKMKGKIEKLECYELADKEFNPTGKFEPMCFMTLINKINELVDTINELKEKNNG